MLANRPRAYSYVRFSTPEQMKGDSLRRQTEAAERYAALHGLELDDKMAFRDLGKSAYRGANEETGHLGEFLSFVESGDVKPGSYLLVESLDRLSRQKPRKAVKLLERICEAGITVVTLDDGRVYTEEVLDDDPLALMVALLVAARAHEESAKKAKRVGAAWANKRTRAVQERRPMTRLCPGWLRLREDQTCYEPIPERAAIVRRVFGMTLEGKGQNLIADTFNKEGVPVFGRGAMWHRTYIKKMLEDPSTIGTYRPHRKVNGRRIPEEPIQAYFPAVIEPETWEQVQALGSGRASPPRGELQNILAGLAKCPLCGSTMTRVNKGERSRPAFVCTRGKTGLCKPYKAVPVEDVQEAIAKNAYRFDLELPSGDDRLHNERGRLEAHIDAVGDEIDRVVRAITAHGHSVALSDTLRTLEADRDDQRRALDEIEGQIAAALTNRIQNTAGRLVDALEADDIAGGNVQLRSLFDKVVVDWRRGQLEFHWRHVEGETTEIMYAWPQEEER